MELIVNNEALDLSEELVMSFQVADIANINQRQGDFSYEFDLPATQKNRRLLKRSHTIFGSPYQYIESWLRSAVDVKKGFIQVTEYDKGFKANFFSGNSNWIAAIGDKTLADLNLSVFDHVYNIDNVIGSFGNTEGYIYPYMNVKSGPDRDAFVGAWSQTIDDGYIAFTKQGGDFYGDYFNEGNFDEFYYTADDDMTVSVYAYINVTALTGAEALISIKINDNLTIASDSELITTTGVVILRKAIEVKENDRLGIYVDVNPDNADPGDATINVDSYVRFTTSFVDLENIAFTELYPALYVHSLIKRIFQEVNFKLGGPFLNNPDYKRMIMPFVGSTFSQVDQSVISKSVYIGLLAEVILNTEAIFFNDETDPYYDNGNWNTPRYNVVGESDEAYTVDIEVALEITGTGVTTSDIEIRKNGAAIFVETVPGTGLSTYTVSTNVVLGDYIEAWIVTGSDLTIGPGSYIKVTADESITSGTKIDIALVPPEMKQIDLISFVFISYGVVPVVDDFSKTLTLTEFRAIKQKSPEDWSAKLAGQYEIDFYEFSHRYAKRNAFKYTDYDDEAELTNYKARNKSSYGDGEIRLDNIFLTGDATIYENKFVPVNFKQVEINGQTAHLTEFIRDNKPRILFVIPNATVSDFASFAELMIEDEVYPVTQIAWAYFTKYKLETDLDDFRTNLSYQMPNIVNGNGNGLLSKYWEDYAGILNRPKMLIAPFKLSIKDLITLDWTRRKLVTGENITGYYFLNRIRDFNFNSRVAKCEMMLIDNLEIIDEIVEQAITVDEESEIGCLAEDSQSLGGVNTGIAQRVSFPACQAIKIQLFTIAAGDGDFYIAPDDGDGFPDTTAKIYEETISFVVGLNEIDVNVQIASPDIYYIVINRVDTSLEFVTVLQTDPPPACQDRYQQIMRVGADGLLGKVNDEALKSIITYSFAGALVISDLIAGDVESYTSIGFNSVVRIGQQIHIFKDTVMRQFTIGSIYAGSPTGTVVFKVYTQDGSGFPNTQVFASSPFTPVNGADNTINMVQALTEGDYCFVLEYQNDGTIDNSNHYRFERANGLEYLFGQQITYIASWVADVATLHFTMKYDG